MFLWQDIVQLYLKRLSFLCFLVVCICFSVCYHFWVFSFLYFFGNVVGPSLARASTNWSVRGSQVESSVVSAVTTVEQLVISAATLSTLSSTTSTISTTSIKVFYCWVLLPQEQLVIVAAERKVLSARSHKHEDKLVRLGKHDDRDTTISERPLKISALVVQDLQMSKNVLFYFTAMSYVSSPSISLLLGPNTVYHFHQMWLKIVLIVSNSMFHMFLLLNMKKARQRCSWSTTSGGSSAFHSNGSLAMNQNQAKSSQVNES